MCWNDGKAGKILFILKICVLIPSSGYLANKASSRNLTFGDKMIKRVWHGWTTRDNADRYFDVLTSQVLPSIEAKQIPGYRGIEVFQKDNGDEIEFVTIMTFDSLQNVIDFQGEAYTRCYVPDAAQAVLKRWEQHASHYHAVEQRHYPK